MNMEDLTGKTLGQYRLVEPIGKGGMATVYKAFQESMGRYVAIKVLPRQFTHDEAFLTRFEREARVIAQLEHRSILPVHDFGEEDGIPYIVMRYVEGGTVYDLIRRAGSLDLEQTTHIVGQVADALDFAHQQGIIHRDLKPHNILIDRQGDTYLSDFGIAKMLEAQATLTGTGVIGTPAYIAPELAQGMQADVRADVYALGVVIFEMLCGRVPFEADTPMAAIYKHVNEPVPSLCEAKPGIPPVVDAVVQKVLAKDPDERFQTAGELARALRAAYRAIRRGDVRAQQQLTATIIGTISAPGPGQEAIAAPAAPPAIPEIPAAHRRVKRKRGGKTLLFVGGGALALLVCAVVVGLGMATGSFGDLFGGQQPPPEVGEATPEPATPSGGGEQPPPTSEPAPLVEPTLEEPTPTPIPGMIDNFEGATEDWIPTPGDSESVVECVGDTAFAHDGTQSLRMHYIIAPSWWVDCGYFYDAPQDWSAGTGLALWVRTDNPGKWVTWQIFSGDIDDPTPFELSFQTTGESDQGWVQFSFPWGEFLRAEWAEAGGLSEIDPSRITGYGFNVGEDETSNEGTVWLDEITLMGVWAEP
jgi:tRNA A-37 threonylcarbamoyl transferase component Bud32